MLNKIICRINDPRTFNDKIEQNQNDNNINEKSNFQKNLWLVITESLLTKFPCPIDLKSFLKRCLEYYLKDSDILNFAQINEEYTEYLRNENVDTFMSRNDFFLIDPENEKKENGDNEENAQKKAGDFSNSIKKVVRYIEEDETQKDKDLDKIIFLFINSDNFRRDNDDDELFDVLIRNKISVYCFCFDEPSERKMNKMKIFLKFMYEGHLIIVKNYEVIERAFQNISYPDDNNKKKNILTLKFSNHNFIH